MDTLCVLTDKTQQGKRFVSVFMCVCVCVCACVRVCVITLPLIKRMNETNMGFYSSELSLCCPKSVTIFVISNHNLRLKKKEDIFDQPEPLI